MPHSVNRIKPRFNKDERAFIKYVPLPPKTRRDSPRAINRNHIITVEESVEQSSGRAFSKITIVRTYEYTLHATKGWRRRRIHYK